MTTRYTGPTGLSIRLENALVALAKKHGVASENPYFTPDRLDPRRAIFVTEALMWRLSTYSDEELLAGRDIGISGLAEFRSHFPPDKRPDAGLRPNEV